MAWNNTMELIFYLKLIHKMTVQSTSSISPCWEAYSKWTLRALLHFNFLQSTRRRRFFVYQKPIVAFHHVNLCTRIQSRHKTRGMFSRWTQTHNPTAECGWIWLVIENREGEFFDWRYISRNPVLVCECLLVKSCMTLKDNCIKCVIVVRGCYVNASINIEKFHKTPHFKNANFSGPQFLE